MSIDKQKPEHNWNGEEIRDTADWSKFLCENIYLGVNHTKHFQMMKTTSNRET